MAFFDDLLSIFSVLLALLIGKLASAAASASASASGAGNLARDSVDPLQRNLKRERTEGSELVVDDVQEEAEEEEGGGGDLESSAVASADELDRNLETSVAEKGSEADFPEELAKEEVYELGSEEEESGLEASLLHGEDEWEGIERSGTQKLFRVAADYVGSGNGRRALSKLGRGVRMRLYGLQKVAAEGPCYAPQPMALKVSARARWHAWQRLGNMNPDVAMEQYISLLSERIPGWMGENSQVQTKHDKGNDVPNKGLSITCNPDLASFSLVQSSSEDHSILEDPLCEIRSDTTTSKVFEKGLAKTFVLNLLCPTRVAFLVFF